MEYHVNNTTLRYDVTGPRHWGDELILADEGIDLTAGTHWHEPGFVVGQLFDEKTYATFFRRTKSLLLNCWRNAGIAVEENFNLDQYHTLIDEYATHLAAIEQTRLLQTTDFPLPVQQIEDRISEFCKVPLQAKNPFDGQTIFHFRVIRPMMKDNNPLHRDVWLEDYADCINLYIPVAGSNELSSLIIMPGSHRWPESRVERTDAGAELGGIGFAPAVTALKKLYCRTTKPARNQVLVSPYLVHGGAVNLSNDKTRISIDEALEKMKLFSFRRGSLQLKQVDLTVNEAESSIPLTPIQPSLKKKEKPGKLSDALPGRIFASR
jgi:hypothetical protein